MNTHKKQSSRSVGELSGVGEARMAALFKMGIETVDDLVRCYPRAYQNRGDTRMLSEIKEKVECGEASVFSTILTITTEPTVRMIRRGMVLLKVRAFDDTGSVEITYFNQQYLKDRFHTGAMFRFFGRFAKERSSLTLINPIFEPYYDGAPLPNIVPIYPLASGLTQKIMSGLVKKALDLTKGDNKEYIPAETLEKLRLPTHSYAIEKIHYPTFADDIEKAKRRLIFEELYDMFLALAVGGEQRRQPNNMPLTFVDLSEFERLLAFEMTDAQKRSVNEMISDMSGEYRMNRILTGDVGSGKTVVAAAAVYAVVRSGYRAVLMAPTEILATQHAKELSSIFSKIGIRCALLTGTTKKREREIIIRGLESDNADERIDFVIGTHALLSDDVRIENLALAVIDEQHRFGVMQRAALFEKAESVHCLVMSATPIPRTLTLAAYGSIAVSRIDELPKGRQKIDTFVVNQSYKERLNSFIKKQVDEGHQVYVVCPAIDEAEEAFSNDEMSNLDLVETTVDISVPICAATSFAEYLRESLPELRIECAHGKMKSVELDTVMSDFAGGEVDVLVSTTVVEVGVNVPNATLMIVENAERFGLSQLHQLRGRVGRSSLKSYFVLVSDTKNEDSLRRLKVIKDTTDGFEIAEHDLELRGPGDFISESGMIRQHGQMEFRLAASCRDTEMLEEAAALAKRTISEDPGLTSHPEIFMRLSKFLDTKSKISN